MRQAGGLRESSPAGIRRNVVIAFFCTLIAVPSAVVGQSNSDPAYQYPWEKGDEVAYSYNIEATIQREAAHFKGTARYRPRPAGKADLDHESGTGTGTAFVVNSNGFLVTCDHVVHGGTKFTVKLARPRTMPGCSKSIGSTTSP